MLPRFDSIVYALHGPALTGVKQHQRYRRQFARTAYSSFRYWITKVP